MPNQLKGLTISLGIALLLGIALPVHAEEATESTTAGAASDNTTQIEPININSADVALLTELPGIGEVKAASIVDNREANGPFSNVTDLTRVKGIGDATVESLEDEATY